MFEWIKSKDFGFLTIVELADIRSSDKLIGYIENGVEEYDVYELENGERVAVEVG